MDGISEKRATQLIEDAIRLTTGDASGAKAEEDGVRETPGLESGEDVDETGSSEAA